MFLVQLLQTAIQFLRGPIAIPLITVCTILCFLGAIPPLNRATGMSMMSGFVALALGSLAASGAWLAQQVGG